MTRPSWDETWLAVARDVAARSLCTRDQVGAVIVSPTNRIISSGYNGPPAGFGHGDKKCDHWCPRAKPEFTWEPTEGATPIEVFESPDGLLDPDTGQVIDDPYLYFTSHGYVKVEKVSPCYDDCLSSHAEINCLSVCDRVQRESGTLYTTSHVCFQCAKIIANSGLAAVVRPKTLDDAAHRSPDRSYEFLERCGINVIVV